MYFINTWFGIFTLYYLVIELWSWPLGINWFMEFTIIIFPWIAIIVGYINMIFKLDYNYRERSAFLMEKRLMIVQLVLIYVVFDSVLLMSRFIVFQSLPTTKLVCIVCIVIVNIFMQKKSVKWLKNDMNITGAKSIIILFLLFSVWYYFEMFMSLTIIGKIIFGPHIFIPLIGAYKVMKYKDKKNILEKTS